MNFSLFDLDVFSMSDFKATKAQFEPEPRNLYKKEVCSYTVSMC